MLDDQHWSQVFANAYRLLRSGGRYISLHADWTLKADKLLCVACCVCRFVVQEELRDATQDPSPAPHVHFRIYDEYAAVAERSGFVLTHYDSYHVRHGERRKDVFVFQKPINASA